MLGPMWLDMPLDAITRIFATAARATLLVKDKVALRHAQACAVFTWIVYWTQSPRERAEAFVLGKLSAKHGVDVGWLMTHQRAFKEEQARTGQVLFSHPDVFGLVADAQETVMLLLDVNSACYTRGGRAAEQIRARLRWFDESAEFKHLVPSALLRVH